MLTLASGGAAGQETLQVPQSEIPAIQRRVPPSGMSLSDDQQQQLDETAQRLRQLTDDAAPLAQHPLFADVDVLLKAVRLALRHGEFYRRQDLDVASSLLRTARSRLRHLQQGDAPWTSETGLVIRGYRSAIDGSSQPYGLEIPPQTEPGRSLPLLVWLHGRGDKTTDLHFIWQRMQRAGNVQLPGAIVLHPFGRQCLGFKSAGEIDVLDAVRHVRARYPVDGRRIVLMGFSMGGAGAWHIGAHYADHWVAVSPGAGFAETSQYNRLARDDWPAGAEQTLWGLYDVPDYVRNLFNLPVVAYSGELDKQIQAARVMERAFANEGRKLEHLIGPGMGHKYHPETLRQILQRMEQAVAAGQEETPRQVSLQTRTLRYNRMHWVEAAGLRRHWQDSRIDAQLDEPRKVTVSTVNISRLKLSPWRPMRGVTVDIDGQQLVGRWRTADEALELELVDGEWREADGRPPLLSKRHGLQGPIDDAWMGPFLVVVPSGSCQHDAVQRWVDFERAHLADRWQALFRGQLRVKADQEVTADDLRRFHLLLWGDPAANSLLRRLLEEDDLPFPLPLEWNEREFSIGGRQYDAASHVPLLIYPNPLSPGRYVVINSGPTFREGHDRTNSLQNPKLPDWAVFRLDQPPNDLTPGRLLEEGFFDEAWQFNQ